MVREPTATKTISVFCSARASLSPMSFWSVRQNHHENELAFSGVNANLIMQPSLVTARQILQMLTVPAILDLRRYLRTRGSMRCRGWWRGRSEYWDGEDPSLGRDVDGSGAPSHPSEKGQVPTSGCPA